MNNKPKKKILEKKKYLKIKPIKIYKKNLY